MRFPNKIPGLSLSKFHSYLISFWYDLSQEIRRFTEPFKAFQGLHSPAKKKKKSPKEGEIAYSPVSRFGVCVCTFLIEANSSACKKSADRDPVLHNLQFVDIQIRADCRVCTSIIFVKPFAWQLPSQEEQDTSSFRFTIDGGNKKSFLVFGWKPGMNEWKCRSTFFLHWQRMYASFSALVQGTACSSALWKSKQIFEGSLPFIDSRSALKSYQLYKTWGIIPQKSPENVRKKLGKHMNHSPNE